MASLPKDTKLTPGGRATHLVIPDMKMLNLFLQWEGSRKVAPPPTDGSVLSGTSSFVQLYSRTCGSEGLMHSK